MAVGVVGGPVVGKTLGSTAATWLESAGRAGCYLVVPSVDGWHAHLSLLDVDITTLEEQPWGMKEFTLTDPDGNCVRSGTGT